MKSTTEKDTSSLSKGFVHLQLEERVLFVLKNRAIRLRSRFAVQINSELVFLVERGQLRKKFFNASKKNCNLKLYLRKNFLV